MRVKEKFGKKLLVEGGDDQHVIWALCERFQIVENFDIIDCEGLNNLLEQIPIRFKQSDVETIGVIIDADQDLQTRYSSLKNILSKQGFILPEQIDKKGLIETNVENKTIGLWIMPNNLLNGMLEDFISFLVPKEDKLMPEVKSFLLHIEAQQLNKYFLTHESKALIHSWLALQEDPGTPLGLAITKRYLTTNQETCVNLIKWLSVLYGNKTESLN